MLYDGRRADWPRRDALKITSVVPNSDMHTTYIMHRNLICMPIDRTLYINFEAGIRKNYWGCTMHATNVMRVV